MKKLLLVLVALLLAIPGAVQAQQMRGIAVAKKATPKSFVPGEYKALIIGNNDYQAEKWPSLSTAVKDAGTLASVLKARYQFSDQNVLLYTNATRRDMLEGFARLKEMANTDDNVLIYYAGHGEFDADERGWWVPVDGHDSTTYISNDEVLAQLRAIKAKHKLLISDSCFSGNMLTRGVVTVPKKARLPSRYVVEKTALSSVQGLSSGGNEPVSDGGKKWGGHSIFAYHLLGQLKANQKPYLSAHLLGYTISEQVANDTASIFGVGQSPVFSDIKNQGSQGGDFFFSPDPSTILDSGGKVALVFSNASVDGDKGLESTHTFLAERFMETLTSLYVPLTDKVIAIPQNQLQNELANHVKQAGGEAALVVKLDGKLQKQATLMWQGHATLAVELESYKLEGGRTKKTGSFDMEAQRLPIRRWSDSPEFAEESFRKTAEKVIDKTSQAKLDAFLESVRE